MEMELVICDANGNYVKGEKVVYVLQELIRDAKKALDEIFNNERRDFPPMPEFIRKKITSGTYIRDDPEKGKNLGFDYKIDNEYLDRSIRIDAFGRDGNVTMTTIILEIVTPPCQYVEELAYWASTLFHLARVCLPKGKNALFLMSTALNPTIKEYFSGLSHGDHHHCGSFSNYQEKIFCYDMVRNFLPNIVALTVNSPFINNSPTDVIKSKMVKGKPRYTSPKCIRSIRLHNNTTMLSSSNEPRKYIPYLFGTDKKEDKKSFLETTEYASLYDARFQDLFPYTKYKTIELRICDAQLSIARRVGTAMLLQTMYYKARKLLSNGKFIPPVNSETLCLNRRSAVERGLIGLFKTSNLDRSILDKFDPSGEFSKYYLGPENKPYRFLFQQTQGMFKYLIPELRELGYLSSPFLKPLLQSVFGDITYAVPPMTEADYQLSLYDWKIKNGQDPKLVDTLIYYTEEYSKDPIQQPLTGKLKLPKDFF